jgi:hypothetical protein
VVVVEVVVGAAVFGSEEPHAARSKALTTNATARAPLATRRRLREEGTSIARLTNSGYFGVYSTPCYVKDQSAKSW